jgi:hypothetical protein
MNRNLVGSIYGRFSIKFANFITICLQTLSPHAIFVSDCLIYKKNLLLLNRLTKWRPIRNKNCLWQPCLLTDRDKMSNLYREPSIDASYQVSVHLAKRFQRTNFLLRLLISSWSVNKHGHHRQFLFLIGWFLKNLLLRNRLVKWTETW